MDDSLVGRTYPAKHPYDVSRAKIIEFAEAIGESAAVSRDVAAAHTAGYPDLVAPPTFLTIVSLGAVDELVADPELGLDYSQIVHGQQSFTHTRPAYAGDRLWVTTVIDEVRSRAGSEFVLLRAVVRDANEELVSTASAQLVVRGTE